jgi:hypothetical protein
MKDSTDSASCTQSFGYSRARGLHGRPNSAVLGGSLALLRGIDGEQCLLRLLRSRPLTFPVPGRHGRYFDSLSLCGRISFYPVLRRRDYRVGRGGSGSRGRFSRASRHPGRAWLRRSGSDRRIVRGHKVGGDGGSRLCFTQKKIPLTPQNLSSTAHRAISSCRSRDRMLPDCS